MTCSICQHSLSQPTVPWTDTPTGIHQYEGSHEGGPYEPARLGEALAHLPTVHEVCAMLAPARARGKLIRLDERLRS